MKRHSHPCHKKKTHGRERQSAGAVALRHFRHINKNTQKGPYFPACGLERFNCFSGLFNNKIVLFIMLIQPRLNSKMIY
jgi:hypothetical protein